MRPARSVVRSDPNNVADRSAGLTVALCLCVLIGSCFALIALERTRSTWNLSPGETINPNTAPASSLIRLQNIGWSRAEAIVAYRERLAETEPNRPAFRNADDLIEVPGIGPKTVKGIAPWLSFDGSQAEQDRRTDLAAHSD